MEENKSKEEVSEPVIEKRSKKGWFIDFGKGVGIGLSMNVPGASGGTTALLENIYDQMVGAVSDLFHNFKDSFLYLLPIGLGIVIGLAATLYPMNLALGNIPFGISCVFAGLVIAGIPTLYKKVRRVPSWQGIVAFVLALGVVVGLCFIPGLGNFDLTKIVFSVVLLAFVMGVIGSFALVVPGVSGSLLLFIFGFYTPIMGSITDLFKNHQYVGADLVYIVVFCLGILVGFFLSSKAMKYFLKHFEYVTYMGILGFIIGSIYAIYHPFIVGVDSMNKFPNGMFPSVLSVGWHLGLGIILLVISSLVFLYIFSKGDKKEKALEDEEKK
jgi:putative membrane protein